MAAAARKLRVRGAAGRARAGRHPGSQRLSGCLELVGSRVVARVCVAARVRTVSTTRRRLLADATARLLLRLDVLGWAPGELRQEHGLHRLDARRATCAVHVT